jgi:hypothetical protein
MNHQSWQDTYQVERLQDGAKRLPIVMDPQTVESMWASNKPSDT